MLVILTEWNEYRALDMHKVGDCLKVKRLVDLRNIYKTEDMKALGFHYVSVGRPEVRPDSEQILKKVS